MALTIEGMRKFMTVTANLSSFPMFVGYLLLVLLTPMWQRVTSPLNLRPILVVYNFLCSSISTYTFVGFVYGIIHCETLFDKTTNDHLTKYFWLYMITKKVELLDTMFMMLRHKRQQISFLHIYHHSSMLLLSDLCYHLYPWSTFAVYLSLNSFVHTFLYVYYGLVALYPEKSPQWKKFITQLQIFQFLIGLVHISIGYKFYEFCIYGIFYDLSMLILFSNFYYHAYAKKGKLKKAD